MDGCKSVRKYLNGTRGAVGFAVEVLDANWESITNRRATNATRDEVLELVAKWLDEQTFDAGKKIFYHPAAIPMQMLMVEAFSVA